MNADVFAKSSQPTPGVMNDFLGYILKKTESRSEHIARMMEKLNDGKRQPCGLPDVRTSFWRKSDLRRLPNKTTPTAINVFALLLVEYWFVKCWTNN